MENIDKHKTEINSPEDALSELKAGNRRFLDGKLVNTDYNWDTDAPKAANPMERELILPVSMVGAELMGSFYTPEAASQGSTIIVEGGVARVTTPGFSVWGVLEIVVSR